MSIREPNQNFQSSELNDLQRKDIVSSLLTIGETRTEY